MKNYFPYFWQGVVCFKEKLYINLRSKLIAVFNLHLIGQKFFISLASILYSRVLRNVNCLFTV